MPTYQYACTVCDERLEAVQKFTDDPLTTCEECGGPLRKVYSPVGIVFKGSGFYRTDSRNGSGPPGAKDKQASGSGDGSAGKGEPAAAGSGSSADKSGPDKSGSDGAKPAKKAEKAGSGPGTGSKVA
ncbi:MAG: FmdB family zinc ribbon protein [Streptosporangiaceae bacterium]